MCLTKDRRRRPRQFNKQRAAAMQPQRIPLYWIRKMYIEDTEPLVILSVSLSRSYAVLRGVSRRVASRRVFRTGRGGGVKPIQLTRPLRRRRAHAEISGRIPFGKSRLPSSFSPATTGRASATKYTSSPNGIINHSLNGEISRRRSRFYATSLQNAYTRMH